MSKLDRLCVVEPEYHTEQVVGMLAVVHVFQVQNQTTEKIVQNLLKSVVRVRLSINSIN